MPSRREVLRSRSCGCAQPTCEVWLLQAPDDRRSDRRRVVVGDEHSVDAARDRLRRASGVTGDHRLPHRHRLHHRDAERLVVGRQCDHVHRVHPARHVLSESPPSRRAAPIPGQSIRSPKMLGVVGLQVVSAANDHAACVRNRLQDPGIASTSTSGTLPTLQAPEEAHEGPRGRQVEFPPASSRGGSRPGSNRPRSIPGMDDAPACAPGASASCAAPAASEVAITPRAGKHRRQPIHPGVPGSRAGTRSDGIRASQSSNRRRKAAPSSSS